MSKTILAALAALAILSSVSPTAIAAPDTNRDGSATKQAADSFPGDFWEELRKRTQ